MGSGHGKEMSGDDEEVWTDLRMMSDDKEGELVLILLSWRCEFITRVWSHNISYCDFWTCWTVNYDFHQYWIVIFLNRNSVVLLHPQAMREQLLNFPGTPASSGNRDTNFLKQLEIWVKNQWSTKELHLFLQIIGTLGRGSLRGARRRVL